MNFPLAVRAGLLWIEWINDGRHISFFLFQLNLRI